MRKNETRAETLLHDCQCGHQACSQIGLNKLAKRKASLDGQRGVLLCSHGQSQGKDRIGLLAIAIEVHFLHDGINLFCSVPRLDQRF